MKKTINSIICLTLSLVFILCLVSCTNKVDASGLWENATYLKDTKLGKGAITVEVEVKAGDQSITFTIKTDKETLGDALLEHNIIAGEEGPYGLYVKTVNGMMLDEKSGNYYWAFYKDGDYLMTGVESTKISDGEHYEIVYERF